MALIKRFNEGKIFAHTAYKSTVFSKQPAHIDTTIVKSSPFPDIRHASRRQSVDRRARFLVPGAEKQVQDTWSYRIGLFDGATYISSFVPYLYPVAILQSRIFRFLFVYGKNRVDSQTRRKRKL
jgi:hypothetical protein